MRFLYTTMLLLYALASHAQDGTFKVATYNVDGLPQQLLNLPINAEGPGVEGTLQIGERLEASGWDIIGLNEDFNYHDQLTSTMTSYNFQTFKGRVTASLGIIVGILAKTYRCEADGLELATRNGITVENERIMAWKPEAVHGYLDNANDSLTKKGFRYFTVTLPDNHVIDVIILHADASSTWDAIDDLLAREAAMEQLYDFIVGEIKTQNPLIIMGDFNCHSTRDRLQELFIDRVNTLPGCYMEDVRVTLDYAEEIDKILYLNREEASFTLTPTYTEIVRNYKWNNDADERQLSDHYPVTATFDIIDKTPTDISNRTTLHMTSAYYDLQGVRHATPPTRHGVYIQNGRKVIK